MEQLLVQQHEDTIVTVAAATNVSATSILVTILAVCTMVLTGLAAGRHNSKPLSGTFSRVKSKIERLLVTTRHQQQAVVTGKKGPAPGPTAWPVIGSLHLLAKYEVPFEGFSQLSRIYGDMFSITLGSTPCVVVNSFPLIKEVLITKGPHFGGRPNFIRYDILFGGDRDNCKSKPFSLSPLDFSSSSLCHVSSRKR